MKKYDLSEHDIKNNYFHFTRIKNLNSIKDRGIIPKIGIHAKALEDTKKVFFVEGLDNLLILFDCWINVCSKFPLIPGMFNLGAKVMQYNWFPECIINAYFSYTEKSKFHEFIAYKYFDRFLKRYTLLYLDIKENIDFSYDDIDQIKAKNYKREYLIKGGYSLKYSDLETNKMDRWNLHTLTDHGIDISKIKLCYINDSYSMDDILKYALENTSLDINKVCPKLCAYLRKRNK